MLKEGFVRANALFMIWLVVTVSFLVTNLDYVSAQNGCCGETVNGDTCLYTAEESCDTPDYFNENGLCEDTSFCGTGCCVLPEGTCSDGAGLYGCESLEGEWTEGNCDSISTCDEGCCQAGSTYTYTTEANCQHEYEGLDVEVEFTSGTTYDECIAIGNAQEKGCCVAEQGCAYITYSECENTEIDLLTGYGFYDGEVCSDVAAYLADEELEAGEFCACTPDSYTGCVDSYYLYSFDSCGNPEEIIDTCDPLDNEVCSTDEEGVASCTSATCYGTFNGQYEFATEFSYTNEHDSRLGQDREHGESWCIYEGPTGGWFDRIGSRHYRVHCWNGEEIIEPCADFREEVCLQTPYSAHAYNATMFDIERDVERDGEYYTYDTLAELWTSQDISRSYITGELSYASCKPNAEQSVEYPSGATGEASPWTVPVGSSDADADTLAETCNTADTTCTVTYVKDDGFSKWKCVANCYCLTQEWVDTMSGVCSMAGDCGVNYNVVGYYSDAGFSISSDKSKITKSDLYITYVGYDEACGNCWYALGDNRGCQDCIYYCTDGDYDPEKCRFIEDISNDKENGLKDLSGVYGSLAIVSEAIASTITLTEFADLHEYNWLTDDLFLLAWGTGGVSGVIGVVVWSALLPFYLLAELVLGLLSLFGGEKTVVVTANCEPWQASSQNYCELCDIPASEGGLAMDDGQGNILSGWACGIDTCESLGVNCVYLSENEGKGSGFSTCVEEEPSDPLPPRVQAYSLTFSDTGHSEGFTDTGGYVSTSISYAEFQPDPDGHLEITREFPPYASIDIGLQMDDIGKCYWSGGANDLNIPESTDGMSVLTEGLWATEHTLSLGGSVVAPATEYRYYVLCQGYPDLLPEGSPPFTIVFTTGSGPDTEAPSIESLYPVSGQQVASTAENLTLTVYLHPGDFAQCKFSSENVYYDNMESTFTFCDASEDGATSGLSYPICTTSVPLGEQTTTLYISCRDEAGNTLSDAEMWYVSKTEPLLISQTSPSGTLYTNDVTLQVQTEDGSDNGNAICSYREQGYSYSIAMENSATTYHEQVLTLNQGDYVYTITCEDAVGNTVESSISFTVAKDISAAEIRALYALGSTVYVITDEAATCQYNTGSFSYGSGVETAGSGSTDHSFTVADMDATYTIICQDAYGNEMAPVSVNLGYSES